jgi:hypothetical protein
LNLVSPVLKATLIQNGYAKNQTMKTEKENNMVTITGGVISKQNGSSISFKLKCEKCGNVEHPESLVSLSKGVTEITTKKCSYCGNNQMIKMKLLSD